MSKFIDLSQDIVDNMVVYPYDDQANCIRIDFWAKTSIV
jgi:kynurenine formamidase